ncbi:MAG: hypothetical protein HYU69_10840 [Bacteroidetes bacterium]|nr:hypothetical protein [Bacteroidota bacterium]
MKKIMKSSALLMAMAMATASFAQLQDEQNVTITMDLQPVLQLKMEGPDQLEFTFDEINKYYAGITKYGATVLKVSASVGWDLWAAGLSQNATNRMWDNPLSYAIVGATNATTSIPVTALELHQFPANPSIAGLCATTTSNLADYSAPFAPVTSASASSMAGNNVIFAADNTAPYTAPTTAAAATSEKYIAGASGTYAALLQCGVVGGSYLTQTLASNNYRYVLDYRILPNLPVKFPAHYTATSTGKATSLTTAEGASGLPAATQAATSGVYAAPGVYTMYVKYILMQDN